MNEIKVKISGLELTITNATQILNMGGPWTGTVSIEGQHISNDCLIDNLVFDETRRLLYFVKYQNVTNWQKGNYFTINFYHLDNYLTFEFGKRFNMVYIGKLLNEKELEIYHAFHDQFLDRRELFSLDDEDFEIIELKSE